MVHLEIINLSSTSQKDVLLLKEAEGNISVVVVVRVRYTAHQM